MGKKRLVSLVLVVSFLAFTSTAAAGGWAGSRYDKKNCIYDTESNFLSCSAWFADETYTTLTFGISDATCASTIRIVERTGWQVTTYRGWGVFWDEFRSSRTSSSATKTASRRVGGPTSTSTWAVRPRACPAGIGRRHAVTLRLVLLIECADGVDVHANPDAGVERLEQLDWLLAMHELRQFGHGDRSRAEIGGVALSRQDGDVCVGRDEVREESMSFLDAVVVVRNRFTRLDDAVLGGRSVRGGATREPRRSNLMS